MNLSVKGGWTAVPVGVGIALPAICVQHAYVDQLALFLSLRSRSATPFSGCAATVWGQPLFEGGIYSKKYSNLNHLLVYLDASSSIELLLPQG